MAVICLLARLVLAAVFAVAAVSKLFDRAGASQAVRDFGVPHRVAGPVGTILPVAELATAVAVAVTATARAGALAALVLLAFFVAGISVNLARGHRPDCRCFGQVHTRPIGPSTLARDGVLAALAAVVVAWGPGAGPASWFGDFAARDWVVLAVAAAALAMSVVQAVVLLNVWRQNGRLLVRIDALEGRGRVEPSANGHAPPPDVATGLPLGAPAPPFAGVGLNGERVSLEALRGEGQPVVLVFTDPHCRACLSLLPEIGRWQSGYAGALTVAVVTRGRPEENRAKMAEQRVGNVVVQRADEIADAYQVPGTPSALLVSESGSVASLIAVGPDAIRALVASAAEPERPPSGGAATPVAITSRLGQAAPALDHLAPVGGAPGAADGPRVVVFWNPSCGFCQQITGNVLELERTGAPLLVLSSGSDNDGLPFRSPVLADPGFVTGRQFGATGTPSAVLIDADHRIASELAVGGPDVVRLITNAITAHRV